jgi:hypothetical protein
VNLRVDAADVAGGVEQMLFTPRPFPETSAIPPFAENAKDGAPDPLWQGKKYAPAIRSVPGFHHLE